MEKEKKVAKKVSVKPKSPVKIKKVKDKGPKKPKVKPDKLAVILTGGKQYLVREGDILKIEKIDRLDKGEEVVFDQVLLVADDKGVRIGTDLVEGAKVTAKSEGNIKGKKVTVIKYKRKTRYRIKMGHRQIHTHVVVTSIQ